MGLLDYDDFFDRPRLALLTNLTRDAPGLHVTNHLLDDILDCAWPPEWRPCAQALLDGPLHNFDDLHHLLPGPWDPRRCRDDHAATTVVAAAEAATAITAT